MRFIRHLITTLTVFLNIEANLISLLENYFFSLSYLHWVLAAGFLFCLSLCWISNSFSYSVCKDVINTNLTKPTEIFCYPNKDLLEREHIKRAPKIKPKVTIEK